MAPLLIVRNLTASSISLKSIENFEDPNVQQSKAGTFPFSSRNTTSLAPSAPKLGQHAQTHKQRILDIRLLPFEAFTLNAQSGLHSENEPFRVESNMTLRLTIELAEGERYRIDSNPTYTQKASHAFVPLTPNPSGSCTALYHPAHPISHLTIHTNHSLDLSKWMSGLPSTLPLSAISIPGTHNSHTHYRALPSVRCQVVSIKAQLENGIRFLDIRVQPADATDTSKKDLYLVHGAFPISLTGTKYLEPVLQTCYDFLEQHPSETILVSLKREGVGSATDAHLAQVLDQHYIAPNASKWHIGPSIPYLSAVRGKLVLVRRYAQSPSPSSSPSLSTTPTPGLDATTWPHNTTHATHGPFSIQDFCEITSAATITQKVTHINTHLVRAAASTAFIPGLNTDATYPIPPGPLFLNFLSGSNFWRAECWPDRVARVVNRGLEEWLCMGHHLEAPLVGVGCPARESGGDENGDGDENGLVGEAAVRKAGSGDGGTGVVVMDCVGEGGDWDLVRLIVGMNMGVRLKMDGMP
ncbi:1-phosphatidylinositol phosphodiesterase precursor [Massariosphaeria phaeospora]|uniref:1-phosphatidylinositol phosphodiesterase n=1 Tax=Massariosphaeria phaeospora TaxID=100035 RepID=A0A7C8HZY6_9PLEO|nr:1-phosphatidylinositol phosphodiesterase precursor [Massariosphaeria phaeospora]